MKSVYHLLLFLLILSFPGGSNYLSVALPGGSLFLFRAALVAGLGVVLWKRKLILFQGYFAKYMTMILLVWIAYGLVGLLWAPNLISGLKDWLNLFKGTLIFVLFISLTAQLKDPLSYLKKYWYISALLVLSIAAYEFFFNQHLKSHFTDLVMTIKTYNSTHKNLISVFSGPNELSVFVVLCLPFVFIGLKRILFQDVMLVIVAIWLIWLNDSKIVMMAVFFEVLALLFVFRKVIYEAILSFGRSKSSTIKYSIVLIVFMSVLATGDFSSFPVRDENEMGMADSFADDFNALVQRAGGGKWTDGHFSRTLSSRQIRIALINNGLSFTKDSYLMGGGPGSFVVKMQNEDRVYFADNFVNPHSWWIEILSQYGIIVFTLYFGWMIMVFWFLMKTALSSDQFTLSQLGLLGFSLSFMLAFLLCTNSSSSFMAQPINWIGLAVLAVAVDQLREKKGMELNEA